MVTPGQCHESTQLGAVLDAIRVARPSRGRPRKRPEHLLADRGYSSALAAGSCCVLRSITHVISERKHQR